eukprot:gnl/Chilomastix_caulleri/1796.p1 GENE.gnl/Chilomastix_caulleri/1796~~gnl/Chilomastix_caulleri/1796.p1  ORF type:complete len:135 (+),score=24.93 gnl/Chilomastix_caulleri/1796:43-447(+)
MSDNGEIDLKATEAELSRLLKTFPTKVGVGSSKRELRACRTCRLVKLRSQFIEHGCENCGTIKRGEKREVDLKLTPYFEGIVAIFDVDSSWLRRGFGKILEMEDEEYFPIKVPGLYAFNVPMQSQVRAEDASSS